MKGALKFIELTEEGEVLAEHLFEAGADNPMAQPQAWHQWKLPQMMWNGTWNFIVNLRIILLKIQYQSCSFRGPRGHADSETRESFGFGLWSGRNSLFLAQQDFDVTAVDQNGLALEILQSIVEQEDLDMPVGLYDINSASIEQEYDFIVSTVVLMFLQADRIPAIIQNMQEKTSVGGYNLIVCAMDTEDYPCSVNFPFTFKEGELADYYKDWELVKYNENPGHLHRRDENGNRIQLRFATLLAKKIK